ncbi:hypothetical protein Tco_1293937 [Tanacetum coccineum]
MYLPLPMIYLKVLKEESQAIGKDKEVKNSKAQEIKQGWFNWVESSNDVSLDVLEEQEKEVTKKEVSTADPVTTVGEVVTTANVEATTANALTTTIDELTLAQNLIEIKAAKPKAITSAATTTTTTRPKARRVVV